MGLEYVSLGSTGLSVSEVAMGTARFGMERDDGTQVIDRKSALGLLDRYAEAGGNFIDVADVYGEGRAEEYVGDWLDGEDREDYVIASKIYWPTREGDPNGGGLNRKHLRRQIDRILDRLGTDYLDLLYVHRWDDDTPAREFMRTLNGFIADGRVNYLGASNRDPNAWQVAKANELARREGYEPFTSTQIIYNLVDRQIESEFLPMVRHYEVGLMPFSPLAGGFLTGKYMRDDRPPQDSRGANNSDFRETYFKEEKFGVLDIVRDVADDHDATPAQVSMAWLLAHPAVTAPVTGARTVEQLNGTLGAAELELTDEEFERLDKAAPTPF